MRFYHGSNIKFDKFEATEESIADKDNFMQEGPGIYFTSSIKDASRYGKFIYEVEWEPKKLLPTKPTSNWDYPNLVKTAKQAKDWKETAMNWDEEPEEGLQIAIEEIMDRFDDSKNRFEQVWYDFLRNDSITYISFMKQLGYDGFLVKKYPGNFNFLDEEVTHAIVFNIDSLKIINIISTIKEAKENNSDKGFAEIPTIIEYLKSKYSSISIKDVENMAMKHFKKIKKSLPKDKDFMTDLFGGITNAGLGISGESILKNKKKMNETKGTAQGFSWKREAKILSKRGIGHDNSLRPWNLKYKGFQIGSVYNPSASVHNFTDNTEGWKIMFYSLGKNLIFTKVFENDKIEEAKVFAENLFLKIMNSSEGSYLDFKNRILSKEPSLNKYFNKISEAVKILEKLSNKKVILKEELFGSDSDFEFTDVLSTKEVQVYGLENINPKLIDTYNDIDALRLPIKWRVSFDIRKHGINGYSIAVEFGELEIELRLLGDGTSDEDDYENMKVDLTDYEIETDVNFTDSGVLTITDVSIDLEKKRINIS